MKLEITHLYKFKYVPFRHQNLRDAWGMAISDVEISEFSDDEVPVVMKIANFGAGDSTLGPTYDRFRPVPGGNPRRVRMKDGYFYVEGLSVDELISKTGDFKGLNSTFLAVGSEPGGERGGEPDGSRSYQVKITNIWEIERAHSGGIRHDFTKDDRGEYAGNKMRKQAARMFVVDGTTYELCQEPIFVVRIGEDGDMSHGIVEAVPTIDARNLVTDFSNSTWHTTSLVHADKTIDQHGLDTDMFSIEVLDHAISSYDGVASDFVFHLQKSVDALKAGVEACPLGMLHSYYGAVKALENTDFSNPSVSKELLDAAEVITQTWSDPEISEPMRELAKSGFMNQPSEQYSNRTQAPDLDIDGPFSLGLMHVADYRKHLGQLARAIRHASHALSRWDARHPDSAFDNGQTHCLSSVQDGIRVTEIGSLHQAHSACRDVNVDYSFADAAVAAGSRLFRISTAPDWENVKLSDSARKGVVALVVSPPTNDPAKEWQVMDTDHPQVDEVLPAVGMHLEKMVEVDELIADDQQVISIF